MNKEPHVYANVQFVARNAPDHTTLRNTRFSFGEQYPREPEWYVMYFAFALAEFCIHSLGMSIEEANAFLQRAGTLVSGTYVEKADGTDTVPVQSVQKDT